MLFPYGETRRNELKQTSLLDKEILEFCYYQALIPLNIDAAIRSVRMC